MTKISRKKLKRYYEREAKAFDHQYSMYRSPIEAETHSHKLRKYWIVQLIAEIEGTTFVDIGCAEGMYLFDASHYFQFVIGVDIATANLLKAKKNAHITGIGEKADFVAADVEHLPFKNHSCHTVLCSEVLEHVLHPKEAIKELARICDSFHIISTPTLKSSLYATFFHNRAKKRERVLGDFSEIARGHIHEFNSRALIGHVQAEGLVVKKVGASPLFGDPLFRYAQHSCKFGKIYYSTLKSLEKIVARFPLFRCMGLGTVILASKPVTHAVGEK